MKIFAASYPLLPLIVNKSIYVICLNPQFLLGTFYLLLIAFSTIQLPKLNKYFEKFCFRIF